MLGHASLHALKTQTEGKSDIILKPEVIYHILVYVTSFWQRDKVAEYKNMCLSSARTPKLPLAADQLLTGECLIPPKVYKAFDCENQNKLWKNLKEIGIPDHLTCLLRNLYASQKATVRINHERADWFQIEKGVHEGCMLSLCLFNLYSEYIIQNAMLDEAQAGIKFARRNINDIRYADDTTLTAESEKELKSLMMKVKEESEKAALKLNIQKMQILASNPITS